MGGDMTHPNALPSHDDRARASGRNAARQQALRGTAAVVPVHDMQVVPGADSSTTANAPAQRQTLSEMAADLNADHSKPPDGETLRGKMHVEGELTSEELAAMSDWDRQKEMYRRKCADILNSSRFDLCINFIILLNSATIGWEAQLFVQGKSVEGFAAVEHIFLVIYLSELSSRFFAFGFKKSITTSGWVAFDFLLVSVGVLVQWLLPLIFLDGEQDILEPLFVFRVLRLLRLARAVRLIITFKTLWLLVRGLLTSADTITFTLLLITMTVYVFAVVGIELITKNKQYFLDRDNGDFAAEGYITSLMENEFSDVPAVMLTLFGFATLDSVNRIYSPMIQTQPLLIFYFMPFILIVSVAMMNLVTAVLVENALESSKNDKEMNAVYAKAKLEAMMPEIKKMFYTLDADGSGEISKEELIDGLDAHPVMKMELQHFLGNQDPLQLFDILDVDGDGEIGISEFCEHLLDRVTSEAPIEVTRVLKMVQQIKGHTSKLLSSQQISKAMKMSEAIKVGSSKETSTADEGTYYQHTSSVLLEPFFLQTLFSLGRYRRTLMHRYVFIAR
ncbi:unnamed protein product [Amoebophrya sp. A25]|nr:unnamed protein product [Amoebophrya sp. A25]|eukprot:GSA25T00016057001.1